MSSEIVATITTASILKTTRGATKFGDVFSFTNKKGERKDEKFLALGVSDKFFSIKASNGELSSTPIGKSGKKVAVIGQFSVEVALFKDSADYRKDFRAQLRIGDVYRAKNDGATYIHLGRVNDGRFFALNVKTRDYATTSKAEKEVVVVGFAKFLVKHAA